MSATGVNTGPGASADRRTGEVGGLQQAIMRFLNCGILADTYTEKFDSAQDDGSSFRFCLAPNDEKYTEMPPAWVKAAMLIRANSLSYGISGVRVQLLTNLLRLLERNVIPIVPLRGSISASGDLIPLSYVANLLQGSPGIKVLVQSTAMKKRVSADVALREAGIPSIGFAPKEAIALVNGTSFSAGAAALILHDVHLAIILAQILSAMAVEALHGAKESFDPYFAEVRPHPGQKEVAQNIDAFLWKSKLVKEEVGGSGHGLPQDRYSLRTISQWLGQEVESLLLAHNQIMTECNSITDNPLMTPDGRVMQGGNFQATSITSAMDRTRNSLQMSGRMLFQQLTEMMSPPTSNGLPPTLTADEPSCDFLMKGVDVAAASYASELAFLSHSTAPYFMNAEQGNQSLNPLALISARYTETALDVFWHLTSTMLVALCQALDLRAIQRDFIGLFVNSFNRETSKWTQKWLKEDLDLPEHARTQLWTQFLSKFDDSASLDSYERFQSVMRSLCESARDLGKAHQHDIQPQFHRDLDSWASSLAASGTAFYRRVVDQQSTANTTSYLGAASRNMYLFVREAQQIPFLRKQQQSSLSKTSVFMGSKEGDTLGTYISRLYRALKCGSLIPVAMGCLQDAKILTKQNMREAKL